MKKLISVILLTAVLGGSFAACQEIVCEENSQSQTSSTTSTTTTATTTVRTNGTTDFEIPPPADTPVTGDSFKAWHESMKVAVIEGITSFDIEHHEGSSEENLIDGLDGYFTDSTDGKWTGMIGDAKEGCSVIIEVADDTRVIAYSLVTSKDCAQNNKSVPDEWMLYATNVSPDEATKDDWIVYDYVYEGGVGISDFTPYGYSIYDRKVEQYKYFKFVFYFGVNSPLDGIRLNEIYLYTEAE